MKSGEKQAFKKIDEYAQAKDFCELFLKGMDSLFQLALVLTGDERSAEECLLLALEDCKKAKVFKPWAESWARLAVIERAIKTNASSGRKPGEGDRPELRAILQLVRFDRFVFVLTVLEKYSIRDCAILLRAGKREVLSSKTRALKQVGSQIATPMIFAERPVQLTA